MKTLTTITGREISVSRNNSKRTYTIRCSSGKYRTYPMSKEDFNSADYWTGNDWNNFLKSNNYHPVK
jgi:hypothetical protein